MYCRSCWANLPDSARACTRCGRDPRAAAPAPGADGPTRPGAAPRPLGARPAGAAPPPAAAGARAGAGSGSARRRAAAIGLTLALAGAAAIAWRQGRPAGGPAGGGADGPRAAVAGARGDAAPRQLEVAVQAPALEPVATLDRGPAAALYAAAYDAYRAGDHEGAVARLREARALAPDRPEIVAALATALEALGAQRLTRGDLAGASAGFRDAVEVDPLRGSAWKGLGFAQLRLSDERAAVKSLETALRLAPGDAETRLLLGAAYYQAGETAAAVEHLRAGRAAAPSDPQVAALLAKAEREASAEQGHDLARSAHFTVSFEGGGTSGQAGYLVSLLLEEAYHRVGGALDYYPAEPVHAVLYPAEQFHDVTRSPSWMGALYDGKIRIPVGGLTEQSELLARVVRHEYTHALVHALGRGYAPLWLNEGLAMISEGDPDRGLLRQYRDYVRRGGRVPSLRQLEGSFAGMTGAEARLAYAQSLAATDYLVTSHGAAAARRLVERLGEGQPLAEAIQATLYTSYDDFDRAWAASLR